jgi:hypothetical protein
LWWVRRCLGGLGQPVRPRWPPAQDRAPGRDRCHRLAPGDGACGASTWPDIRPVASGLHADAVCGCPAGPGCDSPGYLRGRCRGHDDRHHDTGVRAPSTARLARARSGSWLCFAPLLCRSRSRCAGFQSMHPDRSRSPSGRAGVDGYCSLIGQGRSCFRCRRFRVPVFSPRSFGT